MKTNIREYHVELINFKLSQIETINKANAFINHPNIQKAYNVLVEELNKICDDLVYEVSDEPYSNSLNDNDFDDLPFAGLDLIDHTDIEDVNEDKFKELVNEDAIIIPGLNDPVTLASTIELFTFEHEKNEK